MASINVYTNDADEVCSLYAFECSEFEEQHYEDDAASDTDEVRSIYAFESTSYGAKETSNADAEKDAAIQKENNWLREETRKLSDETDLSNSLKKASAIRNVGETGKSAVETKSKKVRKVYCELPNYTAYLERKFAAWDVLDACGTESDSNDDSIESDDDAYEKESVYAYEKPNATCPMDWHGHEICFCGKPVDYNSCDVKANEEEGDSGVINDSAKDSKDNIADNKVPFNLQVIPIVASDKKRIKPSPAEMIYFSIISGLLAVLAVYALCQNLKPSSILGFLLPSLPFLLVLLDTLPSRWFNYDYMTNIAIAYHIAENAEAYTKKTDEFGFQVNNHGTSVSYKMVTNNYTLDFINEKTTVYHDKSGSAITLHYSGSEVVSVTHDGTTYTSFETLPSKVADMLVAARVAVNQLWH